MGVHPASTPATSRVDEPGLDTRAILEAAANGELDALLIFGADPIADFPDADLAAEALSGNDVHVSSSCSRPKPVQPTSCSRARPTPNARAPSRTSNAASRSSRRSCRHPAPRSSPGEHALASPSAGRRLELVDRSTTSGPTSRRRSRPTRTSTSNALAQDSPRTAPAIRIGLRTDHDDEPASVAGPGGQYPKGHRSGAPFQTGQNWPLSWELRAFEARQRPGFIPALRQHGGGAAGSGEDGAGAAPERNPMRRPSRRSEGRPAEECPDARSGAEQRRQLPSLAPWSCSNRRLIYDEGTMVSQSAALRGISGEAASSRSTTKTRKRLGVADGDEVVVAGRATRCRAQGRR